MSDNALLREVIKSACRDLFRTLSVAPGWKRADLLARRAAPPPADRLIIMNVIDPFFNFLNVCCFFFRSHVGCN